MKNYLFGLVVVLVVISSAPVVYSSGEFDTSTYVSSVTDGDTFVTTSEGTIRLADVDAPEFWENYTAYAESKDFLTSLIEGETVYLDIDSLYVTDYGDGNRTVCIAYIDINSTHYLNVNQALVEEGFAIRKDYENDFNPENWSLYVHVNDIPEVPSWIILPLFLVATLLATLVKARGVHSLFSSI